METIIFNSDLLFYLYNFLSSANEKSAICCVNNYLYKICRSKSYFSIQKENQGHHVCFLQYDQSIALPQYRQHLNI